MQLGLLDLLFSLPGAWEVSTCYLGYHLLPPQYISLHRCHSHCLGATRRISAPACLPSYGRTCRRTATL